MTMDGLYGLQRSTSEKTEALPPKLLIRDLQYLLLYVLRGGRHYDQSKWCKLVRPAKMSSAVMVVLNGVSVDDFHQNGDCFPFIQKTFKENLRETMLNPAQYFSSFRFEMYAVPMTMAQPRSYRESPQYSHFVPTNEDYAEITPKSPLFALDCEMVLTSAFVHELARVSIYNEKGKKVYDELVKPYNPIVDPLTRFSGITVKMLQPVTKRLEDVQREIRELLPADAILCGQSLGSDLIALQMYHPEVIDTSVIFNLSGCRQMKSSLKRLAKVFLGRVIQDSESGHSSAEDALATMDLVKLKLRKWFSFGDAAVGGNVMPFLPSDHTDLAAQRERVTRSQSCHRRGHGGNTPQPPVMMRRLFDLLCEEQVSACQIGGKGLLTTYREQPGLVSYFATTDEAACEMAVSCAKSFMFTWVEFSPLNKHGVSYHPCAESSEAVRQTRRKRKALASVDQHVKTLVQQLWEKSLVLLVLPGNGGKGSRSQDEPVAAFLHIT